MSRLRWFLAITLSAFAVLLGWFLLHTGWLLWDGLRDEPYNAHVAVVLGNQVMDDGKPSERLQARLDQAYHLYLERRVQRIIVSGGLAPNGQEEAISMGRYLVKRGVPKEMIFVDMLGNNTFQSARNTQRLLQHREDLRSVVVVSSYYHILRSKLAFQRCGFLAVYGSHARHFEWRDVWWAIPREVVAYYAYLLRDCPPPIEY